MATDRDEGYVDSQMAEYHRDPQFVADGLALEIAEEVAILLEEKGMTQKQLAVAMHVSRAYISKILRAPNNMTLATIASLAIALGVDPLVKLDSSRFSAMPDPRVSAAGADIRGVPRDAVQAMPEPQEDAA